MTDWIIGSCVLIVAVFAIRKVFGTRISSRFRYALWAVVMVRLICPAAEYYKGIRAAISKCNPAKK